MLAEQNRIRKEPILAPRGKLFDRENRLVVDNYPSVTCFLVREQSRNVDADLPLIAHGLDLDLDQLRATLHHYRSEPGYQPIPIKQDVTADEQAFIAAHRNELPELETIDEERRLYPSTSTDPAVYTNYANIACAEITPPITSGEAFGYSVAAAQAVLNYQYWVSYAATNIAQLVDFDRNSEALNGIAATNFPGCCLPAGTSPDYVDSYAVEVFAYLQLPAGTNRFMLYADDAARISTGTILRPIRRSWAQWM